MFHAQQPGPPAENGWSRNVYEEAEFKAGKCLQSGSTDQNIPLSLLLMTFLQAPNSKNKEEKWCSDSLNVTIQRVL